MQCVLITVMDVLLQVLKTPSGALLMINFIPHFYAAIVNCYNMLLSRRFHLLPFFFLISFYPVCG